MKRITLIVAILFIFTGFSVFARGQQAPGGAAQTGPVTLNFIHIWPEHQDTMEATVKMIEDKFGFNINLSVVPWDEITRTIQTALTSGDMYDAFFEWGSQTPGYVQIGAVMNLQPYFDADPAWKNSYLSPNVFKDDGFLVNGNIYGIPFRGTGTFMLYDKTLFDQKGYSIPKTQEELVALMDKMLADGITPIATEGTPHGGKVEYVRRSIEDYMLLANNMLALPDNLNGRMLDYKGIKAQAAEKTRDWYNKGYFGRTPFGVQREEAQTLFFSGKAGMLWCNNNELMDLRTAEKQAGITIDSFQWPPTASAGLTIGYAGMNDGMAVWAGTKYKDQAANLMKGLALPEVQKMWGDNAYSVMPGKNINYSDPLLVKWANEFANMTRFNYVYNYNAGTQDDDVADYFVDFVLNPSITGAQYAAKFAEIRTASITNSGAN